MLPTSCCLASTHSSIALPFNVLSRASLLRARPWASATTQATAARFSAVAPSEQDSAAQQQSNTPVFTPYALPWRQPPSVTTSPLLEPKPYHPGAKRCGVFGIKVGMTQIWDAWGVKHPVTAIHLDACQVLQVNSTQCELFIAIILSSQYCTVMRHHYYRVLS
jgi:hypothetical protein